MGRGFQLSKTQKKKHRGRAFLHDSVAITLRRDIEKGYYPRGTYLPSEADLRARFGVSRTTVRKALAQLSEAGLIQAKPGIGHHIGGTLVHRQETESSFVAVLAPYAEGTTFFVELLAGLERVLAGFDQHLVICSTDPRNGMTSEQVEAAQVDRLLQMRPRAAVVCQHWPNGETSHIHRLLQANINVVQVAPEYPCLLSDLVETDDRLGSLLVANWLLTWANRLALVTATPPPFPGLDQRLEGYQLALAAHGAPAEDICEIRFRTVEAWAESAGQLAATAGAGRLGLFCPWPGDLPTLAELLDEAGPEAGKNVAVGCLESPPWATISMPLRLVIARWSGLKMGESAARLITQPRLSDRPGPMRVSVAPELVVDALYGTGRESTARMAQKGGDSLQHSSSP